MEAEQKQVSSQNSTSFILATCTPRPHLLPSTRRTFYPGIIRFRAAKIALFVFWSLFGDCPSAGAVTEPFRPPFFPQPSWVRHLPPKQTELYLTVPTRLPRAQLARLRTDVPRPFHHPWTLVPNTDALIWDASIATVPLCQVPSDCRQSGLSEMFHLPIMTLDSMFST